MTISAGFVFIYDNKILLEHPTGSKWFNTYSIPKGNVEDGESIFDAAIREASEELGINFKNYNFILYDKGYINYKNKDNEIYKQVYYFVIYLDELLEIKEFKLQKEEVDWAGFLTKEDAQKRIFWRQKELLSYLK